MYQVQNLLKVYNKQTVLKDVNLEFRAGQFVALLGKNGSGKSTLMRLLAQNELFNQGDIFFSNTSLKSPKLELARHIAFIHEELTLPILLSIESWAKEFKKIHQHYDLDIFTSLTGQLEVDTKKTLNSLSRGQKAKALFALHAAKKPKIYLLDEITSVLDSGSRLTLMQFLDKEVNHGALVVMSTNIASELQGYATDVFFLSQGKVAFFSPVGEIPKHFTKIMVKDSDLRFHAALSAGFRSTQKNADDSWVLISARQQLPPDWTDLIDRRALTINDLAIYFTGPESL